jgi:hypothetical protein
MSRRVAPSSGLAYRERLVKLTGDVTDGTDLVKAVGRW